MAHTNQHAGNNKQGTGSISNPASCKGGAGELWQTQGGGGKEAVKQATAAGMQASEAGKQAT
jgi:hypothetical protein